MATQVDKEILDGFYQEAKGYLPTIRSNLQKLAKDPGQSGLMQEAHRLVHSIKGAASMVGLSPLSHLAYYVEETLEEITAGKLTLDRKTRSVLDTTIDHIETYLQSAIAGTLQEKPIVSAVVKSFRRLRDQPKDGDTAEIESLLQSESAGSGPFDEAELPASLEFEDPTGGEQEISPELIDAFREEAESHVQDIAGLLRELEGRPERKELILEVRRVVHTLKGAAGMLGLNSLSHLAHRMEDLLDSLSDAEDPASAEDLALLFSSVDALEDMRSGSADQATINSRVKDLYALYAARLGEDPTDLSLLADAVASPPEELEALADAVSPELLEAFRTESDEHLQSIGGALRELEKKPADQELLQQIRRSVHTLKGAAGMVGLRQTSSLAHRMEDLLGELHGGEIHYSKDIQELLFSTADCLEDLSAAEADGRPVTTQTRDLYSAYTALLGEQQTAPSAQPGTPSPGSLPSLGEEKIIDLTAMGSESQGEKAAVEAGATAAPAAARQSGQYVRVPLERLDELVRLVSELIVNRSTFEQHFGRYTHEVDELALSTDRLKRISTKLETDYAVGALVQQGATAYTDVREPSFPRTPASNGGYGEFDSLEFDRYGEFHLMSRDLSETASDINSVENQLGTLIGDFDGYLGRLGRLTSEVQDRLMRLRMVPLASIATRLHRTVRVTASKKGKQAELILEGERVEFDKTVIEEIIGPLEHLLRNSVDHGIEPVALRQATGKPLRGQIRLKAYYEGTEVIIQVRDDGAGLDPDLIRTKAVGTGYVKEAEASAWTDEDLYSLIFQPGFSTASEVSEVSGRGVGLDILKSAVSRLKGTVHVDSSPGQGVTFTLRLPMTLAITRVLLVKAHSQTFAIPLGAVTQILRIEPDRIERIGHEPVIRVEGRVLPAVRLGGALSLQTPADASVRRHPVLVVQLGDRRFGLVVDQLLEAREVVVKTLGSLLQRVRGVTGATLMGDGSVVLIINPTDLIEDTDAAKSSQRAASRTPAAQQSQAFDVLVVDDSLSVRRVLSSLITSVGWNPIAAKDGVEALEILQRSARRPDVVLLDIEMPRMDGYELTSTLRGQDVYRDLPIIMLTSRAGEKHRKKAFDLGATDYIVKPYQEETLLSVVRRVVGESREAGSG